MNENLKRRIRRISVCMFTVYLLFMVYFLFLAEGFGRVDSGRTYAYNLRLFQEIRRFWDNRESLGMKAVLINIGGNVLCFVPFGCIVPILWRKMSKAGKILLLSFFSSLMIEIIQLIFKVGSFDVDDLLLNTIGGMLGFAVYSVCDVIRRKKYG
ncbi:MAG: VanZ family protein [Eubacteriales bacterium]|nr:VanZ family protein [Eubacteriales bacterium]